LRVLFHVVKRERSGDHFAPCIVLPALLTLAGFEVFDLGRDPGLVFAELFEARLSHCGTSG
jgi:hypothetical protein